MAKYHSAKDSLPTEEQDSCYKIMAHKKQTDTERLRPSEY